jgi:3D (Asp-Asp-Asp) domain-containing protein
MKNFIGYALVVLIIGGGCVLWGIKSGHKMSIKVNITEGKEVKADYQVPMEKKALWATVEMTVTAYCPCSKCCGDWVDGHTANNHKIQDGDCFVAAPKTYAFGTEMIIPGYNNSRSVKVLDRGGAIKGNKLDVFFNTHQEALQWGVQKLDVLVKVFPPE